MRSLQVDGARSFRGGEGQVLLLARGLSARGHPARVVAAPSSALFERARTEGLEVSTLPLLGPWDIGSALRLARMASTFRADLLHAHDAHSLALGALAARLAGVPLVLSRRVDFPSSWVGAWRYRTLPLRIVAVSKAVANVMRASGVDETRLRVVYDGVDIENVIAAGGPEELLAEHGLAPSGLYVGNFASLTDHKGQRYLIEAAPIVLREFPRAVFLIAGQGELRPALERLIRHRHLQGKVLLLGFIPEVRRLYQALTVFVMPSHLEGLGSVTLEAMAAGVPVVVARAGGLPELLENEVHGLIVPSKDPEALARAILRLLKDPPLARRLSEKGREQVTCRFTADHMVEATLSVYRELS